MLKFKEKVLKSKKLNVRSGAKEENILKNRRGPGWFLDREKDL